MGMNQFGDLTAEEFADLLQPFPKMDRPKPSLKTKNVQYNGHIPGRKDWREKGAVTQVKTQGKCGGSWAFGAAAAIESAHFIKSGELVTMSEQVLLDCVEECKGCKSGWTDKAMEYVRKHGITTEMNYPYEGKDDDCKINGTETGMKIKNYVFIKEDDEEDLRQAVARQPVAVTVDSRGFQLYKSGIFDNSCIEDVNIDHSLLVVGYDLDHHFEMDYWILKNSWGKSWGMDGYMKFKRNHNVCGIASYAVYPVL
ncbi:unnamed protein product [Psylliodes chrysocephalus]|uniref:Peptidase C1A papain C-terminal domain-containing protein n=1 Tax=Psylliodes chrysocephalus TaxID=3402493 RepID=A0A9P0GHA7_9CUCU|nr:unnamed protein product [Psylliodes chrysocephala]